MHVVIACDKFKGSLSAMDACEAIRRGLGEEWSADLCPIADGGEGFVDAMVTSAEGAHVTAPAHDPLGREIEASYGLIQIGGHRVAVIEMAAASGMWRLKPSERSPRHATTFGTGELMRHAIEVAGARQLLIGLGGSATNDAGAGMAAALGVRFLDVTGEILRPSPEALEGLAAIDESGRMPLLEILVACDVDNPLLGPRGASAVFGPQKGAGPEDVVFLDRVLGRLVEIAGAETEELVPGSGAAGGLGFGLLRFANARLVSGFDLVAGALGLIDRIAAADLVITGEGSLDSQTLGGKGPLGVAKLAREAGKPVVAFAGRMEDAAAGEFDAAWDLAAYGLPVEESMRRGGVLLEARVREVAGLLRGLARV